MLLLTFVSISLPACFSGFRNKAYCFSLPVVTDSYRNRRDSGQPTEEELRGLIWVRDLYVTQDTCISRLKATD